MRLLKVKKQWKYGISVFSFCIFCMLTPVMAQNVITGTVTDSTNEPLSGVSVTIKKTLKGTITDADGKYTLPVSEQDAVLVFSMPGFSEQELAVGSRSAISVKLEEDAKFLDELVMVGFGAQKKVNLTGAVKSVGAEVFENRPVANIGQALQGVIPNLSVTINSGKPNEVAYLNMRGGTSFTYDANEKNYVISYGAPLILLDGIEISSSQMTSMNPEDIASMSTIFDASAAAIYGTKATYGVILLTSRSGVYGQRAKVSYGYDISFERPSALPDILNSWEIQQAGMDKTEWTTGGGYTTAEQLKLDKLKEYAANPVGEPYDAEVGWIGNFNPYELVVRDWTPRQNHKLRISGGGRDVNYYLSFGYMDQEGMYKINTDQFDRYNVMLGLNAKISPRFNVSAKFGYNQTNYTEPYLVGAKGNLWSAMRNETNRNINMPIMTGDDFPIPNTYTDNILAWISYGAYIQSRNTSTIMSISPEFIIFHDVLKLKADISYTPESYHSERYSPKHEYVGVGGTLVSEQAEAQDNRHRTNRNSTDNLAINAYIDFNKTLGKHTINAILGFNQERHKYGGLVGNLQGMFSPTVLNPSAVEDKTLNSVEMDNWERTGRAAFGRIGYNYDGKYLFEMNGRYDGSSRFTPNERYFFFPSFSAGWRISEESFMQSLGWLDNLKIRGSYGTLGSQPSSNYPYQATMSSSGGSYLIDGSYITKVSAPGLVSSQLTWEKTTTINGGIDITLLRRLDVSLDVYRRTTTDVLTDGEATYPLVLGASAPTENSGKVQAQGFELMVKWADKAQLFGAPLYYDIGVSLADSRTKVIYYGGNSEMLLSKLYNGQYAGEIWGYTSGGILQESDLEKVGNTWQFYPVYQGKINSNLYPGYPWYQDLNGDGKVDSGQSTLEDPGDRRIIGNSTPRYNYGITINLFYRGFDLNMFFQGVGKRDLWISSSAYWGGGAGSRYMYENAWTPERTDAKFPMYGVTPAVSTGWLVDGSYFRMKQMVLGYTLPKRLTSRFGVEKLRFNVSGYNLFKITDIPYIFDPDQVSDAYPAKQSFVIGAQIDF